ncbi:MAG: HAD family hydrolase [Thermoleophilia bacterium]|nr:HAD family hydrolase [Thermoleophilia bacterium]
MISGVIFDCDGTIVDSRDLIVPFYNGLFSQVGLPPIDDRDPEAVDFCMSQPDQEVFAYFAPNPTDQERLLEKLHSLDPADFVDDLRPEPHALEVMAELHPRYRLAIATNRGSDLNVLVRHFGFDRYIDTVVTARDVTNPKPCPDMLLLAAERLGIAPGRALYVGDTDIDGRAAEAAGMLFVCYRRHEPDGVGCLRDLRDLPAHLRLLDRRPRPAGPAGNRTEGE